MGYSSYELFRSNILPDGVMQIKEVRMSSKLDRIKANKLINIILIVIGSLGIADTLALMFYTNINVGTLFPGITGLFLVAYGILKETVYKNRLIIKNNLLRILFQAGVAIFLISFIFIEAFIICNSKSEDNVKADYLVILGGGIKGETVTLSLKERLDKGIYYLKDNPDIKVIVTGGKGIGEDISEAEAMKVYLIKNGISPARIIVEDKSTSTMENFKFSKKVLENYDNKKLYKIMIITNDFHMFRSKMLAQRNGFEAYGITCSTPISVRLNSYIREYFALIKSIILDR